MSKNIQVLVQLVEKVNMQLSLFLNVSVVCYIAITFFFHYQSYKK
jgi:hypothetical protein